MIFANDSPVKMCVAATSFVVSGCSSRPVYLVSENMLASYVLSITWAVMRVWPRTASLPLLPIRSLIGCRLGNVG